MGTASNKPFSTARFWQIAALFVLLLFCNSQAPAINYSCGNASAGHCYGTANWQEQKQYFGSYVDLWQNVMNCPSGCGGFIDNEMWLWDTQTAACVSNPEGSCWVEAGFIASDGGGNPSYFWADSRPMNSNTFNLHILSQADFTDSDHFMIIQDARGASGVYQVWIYNGSNTFFNGTSTSNTMSANIIQIGSELAGTNGASAGLALFQRNIWAVQPLKSDFTFWYNRQTDEGNVNDQSPHSAAWWINPSQPPPPEGGLFATSCCQ